MSKVSKHLIEYAEERLDIERAQICINILEMMKDPVGQRCIDLLQASQLRQLKRMDKHAAAMSASDK